MQTFDKIWQDVHESGAWGKYPGEDVVRFVAQNFYQADRKNLKILDLGCGGGSNTWFLAKEGFATYAIDGSSAAVKRTSDYLASFCLHADVKVSDAASLPYEDFFFDVIIDSALLYANTKGGIFSILQECNRVLKKGGQVFSTGLFDTATTGFATGEKIEENTYRNVAAGKIQGLGTVHFFTREEVLALFDSVGFAVLAVDRVTRTEQNGLLTVSYFNVQASKI